MAKAMKAAMKAAMKGKAMKAKAPKAMKAKTGKKAKTVGGLTKATQTKNKSGKIVSKSRSADGKKRFASSALKKWCDATRQARKQLGIKGFCAVGGKTAQGKA